MNFRVGQEVVYIGRGLRLPGRGYWDEKLPVPKQKYTIRGFSEFSDRPAIVLEEILNRPRPYTCSDGVVRTLEFCFWVESFRPIVKTDISIFEKMLAPAPKQRVTSDA